VRSGRRASSAVSRSGAGEFWQTSPTRHFSRQSASLSDRVAVALRWTLLRDDDVMGVDLTTVVSSSAVAVISSWDRPSLHETSES
jgi:hypothetical protein